MAHKTFISYKYSEARFLRDEIINALEDYGEADYYQGETSESPDMTDCTTETIKKNLKDMIFDTTVIILIISPHMRESKWIPWELSYALKEISRDGKTSQPNGIVGVVQEVDGAYDWFVKHHENDDGCKTVSYEEDLVPDIVKENRYNHTPKQYACEHCKTVDRDTGSYVSFVPEKEFLKDAAKYIDRAYDKSVVYASEYSVSKTTEEGV